MSELVGNPEDWFSHNEAQIIIGIIEKKGRIKLDKPCGEKQWYRSAEMRPKLKLRELLHRMILTVVYVGHFSSRYHARVIPPPLTTGVYRGIHIFLIFSSLNINYCIRYILGARG